ncbi:MAG: methyltransferase domain-containing protein [Pseudonocardiales bacterium]|nr:methyltransferase domain-containing protein [Pseudonocardiales bacterium]
MTDKSMDAAICCFVFVNVSHAERIQRLTREVHRVLRPGGRFIVLDVHPDSTGIQFAGHRNGLLGETYRDGQLRPAVLGPPDTAQMHLIDYHWSRASYRDFLQSAGFKDLREQAPVLADARDLAELRLLAGPWIAERHWPPFLLITGHKH